MRMDRIALRATNLFTSLPLQNYMFAIKSVSSTTFFLLLSPTSSEASSIFSQVNSCLNLANIEQNAPTSSHEPLYASVSSLASSEGFFTASPDNENHREFNGKPMAHPPTSCELMVHTKTPTR